MGSDAEEVGNAVVSQPLVGAEAPAAAAYMRSGEMRVCKIAVRQTQG